MLSEPPDYIWKLLWPLCFMAELFGLLWFTGKILRLIDYIPDVFIDTFWKRTLYNKVKK